VYVYMARILRLKKLRFLKRGRVEDDDAECISDKQKMITWKHSAHVFNTFFFYLSLIYAAVLYIWLLARIHYLQESV